VAGDDEEMQPFVPIEELFKGRHFDRDLVIMMADRGISVAHTTILR
jgi:hypothetical protein